MYFPGQNSLWFSLLAVIVIASCQVLGQVCQPNEFFCNNQNCIPKIWTCDGRDGCGDNSDELSCGTKVSGELCGPTEFKCTSGDQCVKKFYLCDNVNDCMDGSDEIGCVGPETVQPPVTSIEACLGETVEITCRTIGNPAPLVSWRLNWGPVCQPPRCIQTSENGYGVLKICNINSGDQGAYSCEAMNVVNRILVSPDAIVTIKPGCGEVKPGCNSCECDVIEKPTPSPTACPCPVVCPEGYTGPKCEDCAPGYEKSDSGVCEKPRPRCFNCLCNNHSPLGCDPSCQCLRCEHNTIGFDCGECASGYYGNAKLGTENDCKPCPCPGCVLESDGLPRCPTCPPGFQGRFCNETTLMIDGCSDQNKNVGDVLQLSCGMRKTPSYVSFRWIRVGAPISSNAQFPDDGTLLVPKLEVDDGGLYECQAFDTNTKEIIATRRVSLNINVRRQEKETPGETGGTEVQVLMEISQQIFYVGDDIHIKCKVEGDPSATIRWEKQDDNLPVNSKITGNVLTILQITENDEGIYKCVADTRIGTISGRAVLKISPKKKWYVMKRLRKRLRRRLRH